MKWPQRHTIYIHGNRDVLWCLASIMFKEGTDEHGIARHAADEFQLVLEFNKSGRAKVVSIDGKKVEK
jgi:hypothetical protein